MSPSSPVHAPQALPDPVPLFRWWLGVLCLTLLWDWMGADLAVMQAIASPSGFALKDQVLMSVVLHDWVRRVCVVGYLLLCVWAVWPDAGLRGRLAPGLLPQKERLTLALLVTLNLVAIGLIKNASRTSCPWELQIFGGNATHVSHWALGRFDGGSGRCFPGGHAATAWAFLPLVLPWLKPIRLDGFRSRAPGWRWLGLLLCGGWVASAVQTLRGAHYPSHGLWTLTICAGLSMLGWKVAQMAQR